MIVFDEPTSSLTRSEAERLFALIDRLKARGVTLLYVTHRLPEIYRLCERVTVLRDGRHVITRDRAGLTEAALVRAMIGREFARSGRRPAATVRAPGPAGGARGCPARGGSRTCRSSCGPGEMLGLAGWWAPAAPEILQALFGLDPRGDGRGPGGRACRSGRASPRPAGRWAWAWCPRIASARGWCWD